MRVARRLASVTIVAIAVCSACCSTDVGFSERELRDAPGEDHAWAAAIKAAKAAETLDRLLEVARSVAAENPELWTPVYTEAECVLYGEGSPPKPARAEQARPIFEAALAKAESAGEPVGIARAANRLGFCHKRAQDSVAAEGWYRRGLAAAREAGHEELQAVVNGNLAGQLLRNGRFSEAFERNQEAVEGFKRLGQTDNALVVAYNRVKLLDRLGIHTEAREELARVYEDALAAGLNQHVSRICVQMGNLHLLIDERDAARSWYSKVHGDDVVQSAYAAAGLGRIALRDGDYDEAALQLDRAIRQEHEPDLAILSRTLRAEVELRSGRHDAARERLASIISSADRDNLVRASWMARVLYGKSLLADPADPRLEEAVGYFREAVDAVESAGEGLNPTAEGLAFLRERAEPYVELAAALAVLRGEAGIDEILRVIELAHARALRAGPGGDPRARGATDAASLQAGLADGEVLLDFLVGQDRGVVVAVRRDGLRVATLSGWSELRKPLRRYRLALRRPLVSSEARLDPETDFRRDVELGKTLRREFLGSVEPALGGATRLYVVPDQDLALLPFAALPTDDSGSAESPGPLRFLGDTLEVAVLPMAGSPPHWPDERGPILLAGDPLPDPAGEFDRLQLAAEELSSVEAVWRRSDTTRVQAAELTADRLRGLGLERFGTLHLATHAVAASSDRRRCAVILSAGERLGTEEIARLRLGPSLVVLSACQTGGGEVIPGEGVVGLTWAFLKAGAQGITASLWSVEDRSTSELMVELHRQLRSGADPVRALALAQRAQAASRPHPAYWAPFIIVLSP